MVRLLTDAPPTDRVGRYPKHPFQIKSKPFVATPFFIARVLPGETLNNLYFESRVITSPVVASIIGWKKEYYYFYVRVTDLMNDAIKEMFVDPTNAEVSGMNEAANSTPYYCAKGAINWLKLAMKRIHEDYFLDEGQTFETHLSSSGLPFVQIREQNFLDSLTDKDDLPEGDALSAAADMGDLDRLSDAFEQLRALGVANMTYEDWLRSQGISIPTRDENKPEMLARFAEFQYPTNTVDATTGAPTSAVSWVFKNGQRKPKFFKEPGFLVGLSVSRPKIYFGGLAGSALGFAKRAWDWMPNYLRTMPETALKKFDAATGPLGDRTTDVDAHWIDMRDELLYGDQFQNVSAFSAGMANVMGNHILALPDATLNRKYPTDAMSAGFFVDTANGAIWQDGYVSLSIKGHEVDFTNGNVAEV